ncbi:MFS transporter [Longispora albida]|uniref:MFS transporter n=1 Tax=Longispora albida TaxID=203523 RepID=UPI00036CAD4B|nr:MFS transporter [Longispora albida]
MTVVLPAPVELRRRHVAAAVACHFTAAFAALGLPPYLPRLLAELGDPQARWAGVLYIVPTAATALSAPLWGRLADRYGRKKLLIRAQLGLAVAFLLASQVNSTGSLALVLALQGLLGGTFAATGAYLAAGLDGPRLAKALTAAQASARAALVVAPAAAGLLAAQLDVRDMYALAAAGPLIAAALTLTLPEPGAIKRPKDEDCSTSDSGEPAPSMRFLCGAEAVFVLSTVVTFPYLLPVVAEAWPTASPAVAGMLFALPHVVYLVSASAVLRIVKPRPGLAAGFALIAAGGLAHPLAVSWSSPPILIGGRLLLGAGLTLGLVALAALTARAARGAEPGKLFGTVEAWSKGGAVAAGLIASALSALSGPAAPTLFGAVLALSVVPFVIRSNR